MATQSYDNYDQISLWTNVFKGQTYLHMQQKPFPNENKRYRYVFLPIEMVPRLQHMLNSILANKECSDEPINVRTDYEVLLTYKDPRTWQLKVVPVNDKTKSVSQIEIGDVAAFAKAVKLLI